MTTNKTKSKKRGFTLIELMVVLVIFVALTGIMISSQSKFDGTILLNNLAYDIALSIRETQTYGINVKEFATSTGPSIFAGYGVRFDPDPMIGDPTHYILFSDVNNNHFFDGDTLCPKNDSECVKKYALTRGSYIKSICVGSDEGNCSIPSGINSDKSLQITFKRPNPDATIIIGSEATRYQFAKIIISSANQVTTSIVVTALGQIYVQ